MTSSEVVSSLCTFMNYVLIVMATIYYCIFLPLKTSSVEHTLCVGTTLFLMLLILRHPPPY